MPLTDLKVIEKSIMHAFALKEKGVAEQTVLAVFPEERKYIQAAFLFVGALRLKRGELIGDEEMFRQTLISLDPATAGAMLKSEKKTTFGFVRSEKKERVARAPLVIPWSRFKKPALVLVGLMIVAFAGYTLYNAPHQPTFSSDTLLAEYTAETQAEQNALASSTIDTLLSQDVQAAQHIVDAVSALSTSGMCSPFETFQSELDNAVLTAKAAYRNVLAARHDRLSKLADVQSENPIPPTSMLREKATTDTEKQAVTVFQEAIVAARVTRQQAIKKAASDFSQGFESLLSDREDDLNLAVREFQTGAQLMGDNAGAACASDGERTAASQFKSQLAASKRMFDNRVTDLTGEITAATLQQDYTKAVDDAEKTFLQSVADALASLKKEFPKLLK